MFSLFRRSPASIILTLAALFAGSGGSPQQANATQVRPLTLTETIRQAQTVVVGSVVSQNTRWGNEAKRWMLTDYTVRVEEVLFAADGTLPLRETIVVTYWGGTIDGMTQEVADTRRPAVGERLVFMLKAGWQKEVNFSPVVALNYGLLAVTADDANGPQTVRDANGSPLVRKDDGQIAWKTPRADSEAALPTVELSAFATWLRANVIAIKAAPSELKPQADRNDPRVMKVFAKTPELPADAVRQPSIAQWGTLPASDAPADAASHPSQSNPAAAAADQAVLPPNPDYSFLHVANLPITVNNFPASFAPWSPEDQYQMAKWNYYGDVFRVSATPTGTFGWLNGRFDLCGWVTSEVMQQVYGAGWDANVVGICKRGWNAANIFIDCDIALNPAYSFTLDDEQTFSDGTAENFRLAMTHELGHMWGLDHQFNALAVMNYISLPGSRAFGFPYMDDAEGIRAAYPSVAVARTDLAIYLYYATGFQSATDATIPTSVTAGATLTVSNYHIENVGTTAIATPTVEWYLTLARNFNASYFLGSSTYESLTRFQSINLANTSRSFTVPGNVPAGAYYLSAFIRNDGGASQTTFPFSNNSAFSRQTIQVNAASGSLQATISPAGAVNAGAQWQVDGGAYQNSGVTVTNLSVGNHTVAFKPITGWTTPSSRTVSVSANATTTNTGTYIAQTGSLQVTISPAAAVSAGAQWQVDGGAFQNSGVTVSSLSVGSHSVAFKSINGWTTPANQTVTVSANTTAATSATYGATGSLQVTIFPAAAISAGAQWRVDGGSYQNSGTTLGSLSVGNHTVSFKPLNGWITPPNQTVSISANVTAPISVSYLEATGLLQVTISPAAAVTAGAEWQVDGGAYQNSGTTTNLPVGAHTVAFKPISGWSTPANQAVTISADTTTTSSGTYGATTGSLQVTISPAGAVSAGAQWQVDGGAYQNSGVTLSNLTAGTHTVAFKAINGWTTPASQTVAVSANATTTGSGTYGTVPLQLLSAVSTKAHGTSGTFGINLPLTGVAGVECRTGGTAGNYTLVFTFDNNVVSGNAGVASGIGSVSGMPTFSGNTMTVALTGVQNAQSITLALFDVTSASAQVLPVTPFSIGFLVGDTTGSRTVNATDIGQTKAQSGQAVTASNFRTDVTANGGTITASDVGLVKSAAGTQLPP